MKRIFMLLLLFAGMANAQIVTIPDAAFKATLVAASATDVTKNIAKNFSDQWMTIDANGDGEIQVGEAQAVKYLLISNFAIANVTGINSFSNLQNLNFGFSQMTSLDLNALTGLKILSCSNTFRLTSLNINNLTNLTELSCYTLVNLPSLNISNLTNLTKLNISYCLISALDVNAMTHLTELVCMGNQLTNLNGLPPGIVKLNCSNNLLTNLNVNGLTNLTDLDCSGNKLTNLNGLPIGLTKLICSGNLLTGMNLNGLANLTELDCSSNKLTNLNGLPNLTKLYFGNNQLTSFDVSGLTNLADLDCSANLLTDLNVNALANLTKLNCSNNNLSSLSLSGLTNLKTLNCGYNSDLSTISLVNLTNLEDFKVSSRLDSNGSSLGHLTNLDLSGLPNLKKLDCSNGILTALNLNGLTSLTEVNCSRNQITSLNLTNLPNLVILSCDVNPIVNLNASNLTSLQELGCGGGYIVDGQIIGNLQTLNVSGCTNLKTLSCANNLLMGLDLNGLVNLEFLYCDGLANDLGQMTTLNVNGLTSLKKLSCGNQKLTSLNVSNLVSLTDLYCAYNRITNLDLTGLINLKTLDYTYNQLSNLNLVNLPSLTDLNCSNNHLVTLNVLDLTSLKTLTCTSNLLTTLNLSGLTSLEALDFSYNNLTLTDVSGLSTNLLSLGCKSNNLTSLDVSGLSNLETLSCYGNNLSGLDVSTLTHLKFLDFGSNQITSINLTNLTNLEFINGSDNLLTAIDITGLNNLKGLYCGQNQITNLDLSNHENLEGLDYSQNAIPNLDISFLTKLNSLGCAGTQTTNLNISNLTALRFLDCQNNQLTTLDTSNAPFLDDLRCNNNQLASLFIKNGKSEQNLNFTNNPGLTYICVDESQIQSVQTQLNGLGMNTTVCNSYCSLIPGGNHNTITGIAIFDANNDGCDATDVVNPFVKLNINDGTLNGATVTNINGTYNFYTNAGDYVISPNTENPTWFSFSPTSADFTFANDNNNISTQNFCIAALGLHKDIEIVFSQTESARPGFDAKYKVVFKNKGNQMLSGVVSVAFDDSRTDLVSSAPIANTVNPNSLSWNFTNLMPFENRSIDLTLNINGPMETPAVNNGDILNFTASITPVVGDDFPLDNTFNYNQTVIGSFDPNDIICLEGENVAPVEIGNYLHYMVNFENTGTAAAENIVVRLEINPEEFDINSLQVMNASHPAFAEVRNNTVEFRFASINLAPTAGDPPVSGHGNILFKMKTKATLETGDLVKNRANIFFDYNFPIVTNDAETVFEVLSTDVFTNDESVVVFPNPAQDKININCNNTIKSIELYDVQGRILEVFTAGKISAQINISDKSKGIYFVKIITEKGKKVQKIIKE